MGESSQLAAMDAETRVVSASATPGGDAVRHFEPGQRLGHYEIGELIGSGGMGRVYRAVDPRLDREVAIKVLRVASGGDAGIDSRARARLLREGRAMAQLNHPNVLPIYDVQTVADDLAIAMELVEGRTLKEWLAERHDWRSTVDLFLRAASGLQAAHRAGLVHRDFKPTNVLIGNDGRVRVMDFGLARSQDSAGSLSTPAGSGSWYSWDELESDHLTASGVVLGTPAYMAPEQLASRASDVRSDVYSFCVSLWEALYGERPFPASAVRDFVKRGKVADLPDPPPRASIPRAIHRTLVDGLHWDPARRIQSMDLLIDRLRSAAAGRSLSGGWWFGGGLVLAAAVWIVRSDEPEASGCQSPTERLAGVWNGDRATELAQAFESSEVAEAGATATDVVAELDRYAEAWTTAYTSVCEAGDAVEPSLRDRRMRCLENRRHELRSLVDALMTPDEKSVSASMRAAKSMTPISRCDAERVEDDRPILDPTTAAEVHALRQRILAIKTLENLGRYDQALADSRQLLADAESLGNLEVTAEVLFNRAGLLQKTGDYPEAERAHIDAYYAALQTNTKLALSASIELIFVVGMRGARFEDALVWEKHARALIERRGIEPPWERQLARSLAGLHYRQGDYAQATAHTRRSLELARQIYGEEDQQVAESLNNLGVMLQTAGSLDEARASFERALEIWTEALDASHPNRSAALNNLCSVSTEQGKLDIAVEYGNRALEIATKGYGGDHPRIANIHNNLGLAHQVREDVAQAVEHFEAASKMYGSLLGDDHPNIGGIEFNIGTTLDDAGRRDEARPHYERALTIWEAAFPSDHHDVVKARTRLDELDADEDG